MSDATTLDGVAGPPQASPLRRFTSAHPILMFVSRRVGAGVLTLLVASMLIFAAVLILPGNVAQVVLGKNATPQKVAVIENELNLNESAPVQYVHWLGHLVSGDLGNSTAALVQGRKLSVAKMIGTPLRNSLILAALTLLIFVPLCLVLGTFAALRAGKLSDHTISLIALAVGSLPEFLIGTLLIVVFFSKLNLLPGVSTIEEGQSPFAHVNALVLPVLTLLGICTAAGIRLLRASLTEVLREDYVTMARLSGVRESGVVRAYVLRNGLAPATGGDDIIMAGDLARMKHNAIVGNVGHFDTEIDMAGLAKVPGIEKVEIKPQVHEWRFPDGHAVIILSEGRLLNLGNATGHPSFVMSNSFTNQTMAQIELFTKPGEYANEVYRLPKHLDEKVARLHLDALGVHLTTLSKKQADYLGVDVEGPYKSEHYRY